MLYPVVPVVKIRTPTANRYQAKVASMVQHLTAKQAYSFGKGSFCCDYEAKNSFRKALFDHFTTHASVHGIRSRDR